MKRRKLFYVPGLISIIGLPILLYFMGPEDKAYEGVLRLNLPTDKDVPGNIIFSRDGFYESIKKKKIISVDLDDGYWVDTERYDYIMDRKFRFITREVERLQFTNDTFSVLKVYLGNSNTYGDFIRLLNHARLYYFRRYVYVDDCFFFLPNPPPMHALKDY